MNKEIELHDSKLKEVQVIGTDVTILLDKALLHYSEGTPGLDKGTCWQQTIKIILQGAVVDKCPSILPNDIDYGQLVFDGEELINMFPLPAKLKGEIEILLTTQYSEDFLVKAKALETEEIGPAVYLEDFPGLHEEDT
jgi:hypothetical protein